MRLVDADKLKKLCSEHRISSSAFDGEAIISVGKDSDGDDIWKPLFDEKYVPTVEAVPLSVIEKIKAEIERESDYKPYEMYDMKWAFNKTLSIIDKEVKGDKND